MVEAPFWVTSLSGRSATCARNDAATTFVLSGASLLSQLHCARDVQRSAGRDRPPLAASQGHAMRGRAALRLR
jgi:hypothetical protein